MLTHRTSLFIILTNLVLPMPARKVTANSPERLTVTLDMDDRAQMERLAADSDRSLAWIVREALHQYLEKSRETKGDKEQ
jgi:hypothetical protein